MYKPRLPHPQHLRSPLPLFQAMHPEDHNSSSPLFLMLGDSLVQGFDWQRRIPTFTIKNFGVPGATAADLLTLLPTFTSKSGSAKLIMVMIGANDLVMENYGYLKQLKKIIIYLNQHVPGAEVLITSMLPLRLPHLSQTAIIKLNTLVKELCQITGSCYVDIHSRFGESSCSLFQEDGVHLTAKGYEVWARTLLEHIAFLLEND